MKRGKVSPSSHHIIEREREKKNKLEIAFAYYAARNADDQKYMKVCSDRGWMDVDLSGDAQVKLFCTRTRSTTTK